MATSGPPLNDLQNGIFPQLYYCFVFNGIGISFYGLSCTVVPLIYLQILDEPETKEYLRYEPFLNGLGAIMTCILVICTNLGFALIVFSITTYGKPMGFACAVNISVLFIGIYNKIKRHATWQIPVVTKSGNDLDSVQVIDDRNSTTMAQDSSSSLAALTVHRLNDNHSVPIWKRQKKTASNSTEQQSTKGTNSDSM